MSIKIKDDIKIEISFDNSVKGLKEFVEVWEKHYSNYKLWYGVSHIGMHQLQALLYKEE
jgi:hypothetical protein